MLRLMKYEFYKLFHSKSLYICAAILVLFLSFSVITVNIMTDRNTTDFSSDNGVSLTIGSGIEYSGENFTASALSGNTFTLILAIFVALLVCRDFNSGTIKNIIAKGYSRNLIFFAKLLALLFATFLLCFLCWLVSGALSSAFWGFGGAIDADFILTLSAQLAVIIGYASLFFAAAICIKKAGGVLAVNVITPIIISTLLDLLTAAMGSGSVPLANYWLSGCLASITAVGADLSLLTRGILCGSIYCLVFLAIGFTINRKSEI